MKKRKNVKRRPSPLPLLYEDTVELDIIEAQLWWLEKRDKAPEAFEEDLTAALEYIASWTNAGELVAKHATFGVRRIVVGRSGHKLYYRINDDETAVVVLSLWGGQRRGDPEIGHLLK